jgi:hypothetical protein
MWHRPNSSAWVDKFPTGCSSPYCCGVCAHSYLSLIVMRAEMDERKAALIDALAAKCQALLDAEHSSAADAAADGAAAIEV